MIENGETLTLKTLSENALLMLSMWDSGTLSPEEREMFRSLLTYKEASQACQFMLGVVLRNYAEETGRTPEELSTHVRGILLGISQMEG